MKFAVIFISAILMIISLIKILLSAFKSESKKEGIAILLMIFEPADEFGYLFYIGLFGVIAGFLLF